MPFRQTAATAGGGRVLGNKHRMAAHGGLFTVVDGVRGARRFAIKTAACWSMVSAPLSQQYCRSFVPKRKRDRKVDRAARKKRIRSDISKRNVRRWVSFSRTATPASELPVSSSSGLQTAIAISWGTMATTPPPTPDLAGRPTRRKFARVLIHPACRHQGIDLTRLHR